MDLCIGLPWIFSVEESKIYEIYISNVLSLIATTFVCGDLQPFLAIVELHETVAVDRAGTC